MYIWHVTLMNIRVRTHPLRNIRFELLLPVCVVANARISPVAAMPMEEVGKVYDYAWTIADSMGYMCADMTM